jgi:hypothetical protein
VSYILARLERLVRIKGGLANKALTIEPYCDFLDGVAEFWLKDEEKVSRCIILLDWNLTSIHFPEIKI